MPSSRGADADSPQCRGAGARESSHIEQCADASRKVAACFTPTVAVQEARVPHQRVRRTRSRLGPPAVRREGCASAGVGDEPHEVTTLPPSSTSNASVCTAACSLRLASTTVIHCKHECTGLRALRCEVGLLTVSGRARILTHSIALTRTIVSMKRDYEYLSLRFQHRSTRTLHLTHMCGRVHASSAHRPAPPSAARSESVIVVCTRRSTLKVHHWR
jgi:hypothetical protein